MVHRRKLMSSAARIPDPPRDPAELSSGRLGAAPIAPPPRIASEATKIFECSIHGEILRKSVLSQMTSDITRCPKKGCEGIITSRIHVTAAPIAPPPPGGLGFGVAAGGASTDEPERKEAEEEEEVDWAALLASASNPKGEGGGSEGS